MMNKTKTSNTSSNCYHHRSQVSNIRISSNSNNACSSNCRIKCHHCLNYSDHLHHSNSLSSSSNNNNKIKYINNKTFHVIIQGTISIFLVLTAIRGVIEQTRQRHWHITIRIIILTMVKLLITQINRLIIMKVKKRVKR